MARTISHKPKKVCRSVSCANIAYLCCSVGSTADSGIETSDIIRESDNYGIKILVNPPSTVLDIVFIHGLTGSAYSTWLHEGSSTHWPRDLIKHDMNAARVMTFGYDADIVRFWGQAAQDGISGYANDLLGKLARKRKTAVSFQST